ncbi:MAG TPA: hypothetical protein VM934_17110 [Pyrinomonadaceae bacterium]|nr:hypothetical protein [Pyrinomonadaceae bacterium]
MTRIIGPSEPMVAVLFMPVTFTGPRLGSFLSGTFQISTDGVLPVGHADGHLMKILVGLATRTA